MRIEEVKSLTLADYEVLISAVSLRNIDKSFYASYQAWLNQQVKATKKRGKKIIPYFKDFDKFYNVKKEEDKVWRHITHDYSEENKNDDVDIEFLNLIKKVNNG